MFYVRFRCSRARKSRILPILKKLRTSWKIKESQIFLFGEEKLVAPLIALPYVDFCIRRQKRGKG
jgi:hypothetical protein